MFVVTGNDQNICRHEIISVGIKKKIIGNVMYVRVTGFNRTRICFKW